MTEGYKRKNQHEVIGDEYLDLVDGQDQVVGQALRSKVYKEGVSNFRVVNGFITNDQGQLWIPVRQSNKRIFPNAFDFSVGEHVESGESYDLAFRRGAKEELNIDIDTTGYRLLGKLTPGQDGTSSFMQAYEIPIETTPNYNIRDFSSSSWLYPNELRSEIQGGRPAKSDLITVLNRFYPANSGSNMVR